MELVKRFSFISFCVYLFFVPFNWTWTNIFWFISVLGVLINKDVYKKNILKVIFDEEKFFIFFSSCYVIWCFVSLLWSEDLDRGFLLSGRYVSIMFFPIFICLARIGGVLKRHELLIWAFVAGVLVSSCACLYLSYQDCWHETENGTVFNFDIWNRDITVYETFTTGHSYFTYVFLSHFTHPAYYSIHFIYVLIFLIYMLLKQNKLWIKIVISFMILYCFVFVLFLQCRAELMSLIFVSFIFLLYYSISRKYYKSLVLGGLIIGGIIFVVVPHTRLSGMISGLNKILDRIDNQSIQPNLGDEEYIRIFLWKNAFEIIKREPILGVGIGDVDSEMEKENIKAKIIETSLGSHNQYLYCWLAMGILGFLLLLAMFASAFYYGVKNRYFPLITFVGVIMICISFENMLTRVYGIMFIPWAMQLLLIMSKENVKPYKIEQTNV